MRSNVEFRSEAANETLPIDIGSDEVIITKTYPIDRRYKPFYRVNLTRHLLKTLPSERDTKTNLQLNWSPSIIYESKKMYTTFWNILEQFEWKRCSCARGAGSPP